MGLPPSKWDKRSSINTDNKIILHNLQDGNMNRSQLKIKAQAVLATIDCSNIISFL